MGLLVISLFFYMTTFSVILHYVHWSSSNAFAVWSKGPPTGSQDFYFGYLKSKVWIYFRKLTDCNVLKSIVNIVANMFTFDRNIKKCNLLERLHILFRCRALSKISILQSKLCFDSKNQKGKKSLDKYVVWWLKLCNI